MDAGMEGTDGRGGVHAAWSSKEGSNAVTVTRWQDGTAYSWRVHDAVPADEAHVKASRLVDERQLARLVRGNKVFFGDVVFARKACYCIIIIIPGTETGIVARRPGGKGGMGTERG